MVYLMSGFRGNALLAIDLSKASGDITGTDAVVWSYDQYTPYTPSPVLMKGKLYFLKGNNGYLSCLDAADGSVYYTNQRLEGIKNIFSSPIAVGDRLYILGMDGTTCVVRQGERLDVMKQNSLEDKFIASPVVSGDCLYLRGEQYLYCICGE
jgi:outer membrane protein assembly factor BamB